MVTDQHLFGAVRAEHGVRGVDGHAHPHELVLVHLVAAALGQRLAQPHHLDAGLQRVVAGDEADVAAADDEQARGRPHEVAVDERLEGAGAVDPGQRVALEDQRLLARACGHEQHFGPDDEVAAVAQDADAAVREHRERRAVQPDADVLEQADVAFEARGDVDAPRARIAGVDRPEELVRLQHQLAAEAVLVVDHERPDARAAQLDRRRQSGRPAADDQALAVDRRDVAQSPAPLDVRQRRLALERGDAHARLDGDHARLHRQAVRHHRALGALAVGAEDPLGRAVLVVVAEHAHAVGEERRRDGFAGQAGARAGRSRRTRRSSRAGTGRIGCWRMRYSTTGVTPGDGHEVRMRFRAARE